MSFSLLQQMDKSLSDCYSEQKRMLEKIGMHQAQMQSQIYVRNKQKQCFGVLVKEIKHSVDRLKTQIKQQCQQMSKDFMNIFVNVKLAYEQKIQQMQNQIDSFRGSPSKHMKTQTKKQNCEQTFFIDNEEQSQKKVKIADILASYHSQHHHNNSSINLPHTHVSQSQQNMSQYQHNISQSQSNKNVLLTNNNNDDKLQEYDLNPLNESISELFSINEQYQGNNSCYCQIQAGESLHNMTQSIMENNVSATKRKRSAGMSFQGKENYQSYSKDILPNRRMSANLYKQTAYSSKLSGLRRNILGRKKP